MNVISLFSILSLSGCFASQKLAKHELFRNVFSLIKAGTETLDQVKAIFENASADFNDDFECIEIITRSNNVEVAEYLLSKSINLDRSKRIEKIRQILDIYLAAGDLVPGETGFKIASACLTELEKINDPEIYAGLQFELERLILDGNLPMVKVFVATGHKLPSKISRGIRHIKKNNIETIKYLVGNGYDINNDDSSVYLLLKSNDLSAADFEFFLDHGLNLNCKFSNENWLEVALQIDRLDIAALVYKKGLRLSKEKLSNPYAYDLIQEEIEILIKDLALSASFETVVKVMHSGYFENEKIADFMPIEMILEISKIYYGLEIQRLATEIYQ